MSRERRSSTQAYTYSTRCQQRREPELKFLYPGEKALLQNYLVKLPVFPGKFSLNTWQAQDCTFQKPSSSSSIWSLSRHCWRHTAYFKTQTEQWFPHFSRGPMCCNGCTAMCGLLIHYPGERRDELKQYCESWAELIPSRQQPSNGNMVMVGRGRGSISTLMLFSLGLQTNRWTSDKSIMVSKVKC